MLVCLQLKDIKDIKDIKDTERDMMSPYPRGYQRLRRPMGRQEP